MFWNVSGRVDGVVLRVPTVTSWKPYVFCGFFVESRCLCRSFVHSQQSTAFSIKKTYIHFLIRSQGNCENSDCYLRCVCLSVLSIRPSLRMEQRGSCRTDSHEITYLGFLLPFAGTFEFWLGMNEKQTVKA
jgi:hypothetical protein